MATVAAHAVAADTRSAASELESKTSNGLKLLFRLFLETLFQHLNELYSFILLAFHFVLDLGNLLSRLSKAERIVI